MPRCGHVTGDIVWTRCRASWSRDLGIDNDTITAFTADKGAEKFA